MIEIHPVLKKLNYKELGQPVLIWNAPQAYDEVLAAFQGEVHTEPKNEQYNFIQVFGTTNEQLQQLGIEATNYIVNDGVLWLCYPKKTSKQYKGSDCSRETVTGMLSAQGYEPVRQVAVDDDWSALRFRQVEKIKTMKRNFAVTELGKQRTEQ